MKNICAGMIWMILLSVPFVSMGQSADKERIKYAIKLPSFFTSGMVLQRSEPIRFYGFGKKGTKVTVQFNGEKVVTKIDKNGAWRTKFESLQAGGPYTAQITTPDTTIVLEDILIGDVWLCSGQSNMEYPMKSASWAPQELANANYPNLRIIKVERTYANHPQTDVVSSGWSAVTPESMVRFGAVPYFFGKQIYENENVPIGLVLAAYSGSDIISWISESSIKQFPYIYEVLEKRRVLYKERGLNNPPTVKKIRTQFVQEHALKFLPFDSAAFSDKYFKDVVDVPFRFSEKEELKNFIGEVYLQKTFRIPAFFEGKSLQFRLARWDDYAEFYINGKLLETTTYRKDWVMFNVQPDELKFGTENTFTIRLINLSDDGGTNDKPAFYLFHPVNERTSMNFLSGEWKYVKGKPLPQSVEPLKMSNDFAQCRATPTGAYNAMIAPLKDQAFKGVIWYQGENNCQRAYEYRELFPTMIKDWRNQLQDADLPFLFVQLPNCRPVNDSIFASQWAELREAQAMALQLPNTAMATTIDLGEAKNIHPENKKDVGYRLFLAAQKLVYDKDVVSSGPTFKKMEAKVGKLILSFDHIGSGLIRKDTPYGYVNGFVVAGADKQFYHAIGMINGDKVELYCPYVKTPVAVRYAWADNPGKLNLYNAEGLPAVPFRTDEWEGITKNEKYSMDFKEISLPVLE